jgi:cell division septum initiation protein DivIVA
MSENGHRALHHGEADVEAPPRPFQDAERVAEEWAEKTVRWLARTAERAREQAEDIWAEAQAKRREL